MSRAPAILELADPARWSEIEALLPPGLALGPWRGPSRREVPPGFEREGLPALRAAGLEVLVRFARQAPAAALPADPGQPERLAALSARARELLGSAARHARDGQIVGWQAWDPLEDVDDLRALFAAGWLEPVAGEGWGGVYRLDPALPQQPEPEPDFAEALLPVPEDLPGPGPGALALLHDLGALAAALAQVSPRRGHDGSLLRADARQLGRQLGLPALARDGRLEGDPRWKRALDALELLGAASFDPVGRRVTVEPGLEDLLAGEAAEALDRLARRMLDPDLRLGLPALRAALRQAGDRAVDEPLFLELLFEQRRELLFPAWRREGRVCYPAVPGERLVPFDRQGWEAVEARILRKLLERCERLGLLRRAPGVFAATPDGRLWAGAGEPVRAPLLVSSDLELFVPPDALTPWERYQVERLGRCLGRDVVDRFRLERGHLVRWLQTHDLEEALALLRRRARAVPAAVEETLAAWAASAGQVTLTCGVVLEDAGPVELR